MKQMALLGLLIHDVQWY